MGDSKLKFDKSSLLKVCRILTILSKVAPASSPAGSGAVELTGVTRQADGSDVVSEKDRSAELHQGDVVV